MRLSRIAWTLTLHLSLILVAALSIFPFYWMFVVGSNTTASASRIPPALLPGSLFVENAERVFEQVEFIRGLINSLFVSGTITVSVLFLSSMAGFAFSKLRFPGKSVLFFFVIGTMMVPLQLGMIPQYMIMQAIGWVNDLKAVIVPFAVTGFGVFWMRQYISGAVPDELLDSARIDGANNFRIYLSVVVPIIPPAFGTLGIITFMKFWNEFIWPLVVLRDASVQTVQIMLRTLQSAYFVDYSLVLAATFLATLPVLLVFMLFSRQFISGIGQGAVKG